MEQDRAPTPNALTRWFDRTSNRLVARLGFLESAKLSWMLIVVAIAMLAAGFALLSSLGNQLSVMHSDGTEGYKLERYFGRSHLDAAVPTWKEAWARFNETVRETRGRMYRSPRRLANLSILLDFVLFMPGYLIGGLGLLVRGHRRTDSDRLKPFLRWAMVFLIAVFALDAVENVITWRLIESFWSGSSSELTFAIWTLSIVTSLKWALAIAVVATLLMLAFRRLSEKPNARGIGRLLRPQIVIGVITFVLLALPIQLADLLIRAEVPQALWMSAAAILLAVTVFATGRLITDAFGEGGGNISNPRWGLLLSIAAIPVGLAGLNAATEGNPWVPLIPLGIAVVVLLAGYPIRELAGDRVRKAPIRTIGQSALTVPQGLASVVVAAAGLAALRVSMIPYVERREIKVLLTTGIALMIVSIVIPVVLYYLDHALSPRVSDGLRALARDRNPDDMRRRRFVYWPVVIAAFVIVVLIGTTVVAEPESSQAFGAIAVFLFFLTGLTVVISLLVLAADWWTDRFGVPIALDAIGFRGIPVFVIILIWGLVAVRIDDGRHWEVRTLKASPAPAQVTLTEAFDSWTAQEVSDGDAKRAKPLVIVATSGGGIRSAYWTALTLDCLFMGRMASTARHVRENPCDGPPFGNQTDALFVASGISGGSLGLVAWDANPREQAGGSWVQDRLGSDFVSPSVAQGLFVELPRAFLHFSANGRAEALEEAWEATWTSTTGADLEEGFLATQRARYQEGGPFLVLNGASVSDGCALSVSLIDMGSSVNQSGRDVPPALTDGDCTSISRYTNVTNGVDLPGALPATLDLVDYLTCPDASDVRRSTAALLSARFPYVSSAGQLQGCAGGASTKFILDGGYVDTSAAEAALAVWLEIDALMEQRKADGQDVACVVPYFVQIDNDYSPTLSPRERPKPPNQLIAPITALTKTNGLQSRAARARGMGALTFTRPWLTDGSSDHYALIAPRTHPGVQAPLGWTLSEASRRDLETQLYVGNRGNIDKVRTWLARPGRCNT